MMDRTLRNTARQPFFLAGTPMFAISNPHFYPVDRRPSGVLMQHTHRHPRRLWSILLTFVALLGAGGMAQAQVVYTYDAAPVISIPEDGGQANCRAPSGLTRSVDIPFTVTDTFTVGDVALGVDISHNRRGQIQIQIDPPGATGFTTVLPTSTDTDDNYRIMLSGNTEAWPTTVTMTLPVRRYVTADW
ncbi:MAG: hypothetical protein IPH50_15300 [Rhodanobacteraceae bacterium]|nr:hypothetical protein [Rhodanobacteraceae bacterium]